MQRETSSPSNIIFVPSAGDPPCTPSTPSHNVDDVASVHHTVGAWYRRAVVQGSPRDRAEAGWSSAPHPRPDESLARQRCVARRNIRLRGKCMKRHYRASCLVVEGCRNNTYRIIGPHATAPGGYTPPPRLSRTTVYRNTNHHRSMDVGVVTFPPMSAVRSLSFIALSQSGHNKWYANDTSPCVQSTSSICPPSRRWTHVQQI